MSVITGPVFGLFGGQTTDGESQWRVNLNNALLKIDSTVSLSVININQQVQPANPNPGDRYVLAVGVTGQDFVNQDKKVAVFTRIPPYSTNNPSANVYGWVFYDPIDGLTAYEITTNYTYIYQASTLSWILKPVASIDYIIPNVGEMGGRNASVSNGSLTVIDTIDKTTFSSAKYTIQVKYSTNYQVVELLVTSDGTIAQYTEYAKLKSNLDLGTFSVAISGNNIQLKFLPSNSGSMTLRIMRTAIYI